MKTEALIQFAIRQTTIMLMVIVAVPLIALITTLLLAIVSNLFTEQLHSLMILSTVGTTIYLISQHIRRQTPPS